MSKFFLFVIARGDTKRYELASQHFGEEPEVEIVFDRRVCARRAKRAAHIIGDERRQNDRRWYDISQDLSLSGWAYIRRVIGAEPQEEDSPKPQTAASASYPAPSRACGYCNSPLEAWWSYCPRCGRPFVQRPTPAPPK